MVRLKRKYLLFVLLTVLVAFAVAGFAFWDRIAVYVAPKAVLTEAVTDTITQLKQRYENSPVSVIGVQLDPKGCYTAQMELKTKNDLAGEIAYSMTVLADASRNRLQGNGIASASGNDLDISVYLDKDFMALSSDDLLGGAYYGITYESFSEDIRGIPLVDMFISDSILEQWDASVAGIQSAMGRSYQLPELPEISQEELQKAMTAILLLPSEISRVELPVGGVYGKGHRIDYSAEGEQVGELLRSLMDTGDGSDAVISASFYLYENQLVLMYLQGSAGENSVRVALELQTVSPDTITFRAERIENGQKTGLCVRHSAENSQSYLYETWSVYPNFEAAGEMKSLSYRWEPVMGELVISGDMPVTLHIKETGYGLQIITDNFERLSAMISGQPLNADAKSVSGSMTLRAGAEISTPGYKNISDWSLDDLLILLGGIGSLIGLRVE